VSYQAAAQAVPDGYSLLAELDGSHDSKGGKYAAMTMPFGKHKGRRLAEIPSHYLCWILNNCDHLDRRLRRAIEGHLEDNQYAQLTH
jgi:hypothetical protein